MDKHGPNLPAAVLAAALVVLATTGTGYAAPHVSSTPANSAGPGSGGGYSPADSGRPIELAQCHEGHDPSSRCENPERRRRSSYDDEYIFGLTRGVADSTMHPVVKVLVFPVTLPLDFVLLPFEVIGGLFGS